VGPHFEIREDGIVDFVPASDLDAEGNNVKMLRNLQPALQRLIAELLNALTLGNAQNTPHFSPDSPYAWVRKGSGLPVEAP
jgi:hypothetical protein